MKRRNIIKYTTIGVAGASLNACRKKTPQPPSKPDQPIINWRMATSWDRYFEILFEGIETLCRSVSTMTEGRFTITPYPGGDLAPPLEVFDAVSTGTVECCHTNTFYSFQKSPALAFGTTLPFGLNAQQQNAWLYKGKGLDTLQTIFSEFNLIGFPAGNSGTQMGGWFRREINTVADLKNLRMRLPGLGGQIMSRLGVNVVTIAGQDIVPALLEGSIDAVEWIGPYDDDTLGLQRAAPYYYYPGWWEPGTTYMVLVNQAEWNKLPSDYQAIFQTAAAEANLKTLARYNAVNGEILERFLLGGTKLMPFSPEILDTARKTAFELYEEIASQDATFRDVYSQWQAFREQLFEWNRVSTLSFTDFAYTTIDN
ncbi:TRAP transporter substrate-binding protein [Coleofasciculus sp. E2-BRE-01]|uniref:TRAP transporter substrate-binding protein n=1 Tax=Coleofasciculus sp. E2-BRE-01 TaxID=3069524 RepID=UPI0032FA4968